MSGRRRNLMIQRFGESDQNKNLYSFLACTAIFILHFKICKLSQAYDFVFLILPSKSIKVKLYSLFFDPITNTSVLSELRGRKILTIQFLIPPKHSANMANWEVSLRLGKNIKLIRLYLNIKHAIKSRVKFIYSSVNDII